MRRHRLGSFAVLILIAAAFGCATAAPNGGARETKPPETANASAAPATAPDSTATEFPPDPFPSTYVRLPSRTTVIRHAHVYTGAGDEIADGDVLMRDGKIAAVGAALEAPADAVA